MARCSAVHPLYGPPSVLELNTTAIILGDKDGAAAWDWDGMYSAREMRATRCVAKGCLHDCPWVWSETSTPPSGEIQSKGRDTLQAASHSANAPIHTTHPAQSYYSSINGERLLMIWVLTSHQTRTTKKVQGLLSALFLPSTDRTGLARTPIRRTLIIRLPEQTCTL